MFSLFEFIWFIADSSLPLPHCFYSKREYRHLEFTFNHSVIWIINKFNWIHIISISKKKSAPFLYHSTRIYSFMLGFPHHQPVRASIQVVQATVVQGSYVPPNGNRPNIQMGQPIVSSQAGGKRWRTKWTRRTIIEIALSVLGCFRQKFVKFRMIF